MVKIKNIPRKIALIYTALGLVWIFTSDYLTQLVVPDNLNDAFKIQNFKGSLFVLLSATLIYFLAKHYINKFTEKEADYFMLFKNNPNPMWIYDVESKRFLEVNETALQVYGYTKDELLKMTIFDIRPPQEKEKLKTHFKGPLPNFSRGEWLHLTKSGQELLVEISSFAINFQNRPARLVIAYNLHTSAENIKKLTIENFELSNFRFALEEATILSITDAEGRIEFINNLFERISGYKQEELHGRDFTELKSKEHSAYFFDDMWQTIRNGEIWRGEIKNIAKDGSAFWLYTQIVALKDHLGNTQRYISISSDITSRKMAEESLERHNRQLQSIAWANSHLIRKPLSSILGLLELIKLNDGLVSPQTLDYLKKSGKQLDEVIKEINSHSSSH
ncbi:PAS domain S-box protein [bacterium]|nr:PAS domain S-box protein [bacterium]